MKQSETIDNLLTKAKNKFLLSNAIAARAKEISEGSLPYVDNFDPSNPIITAIRELGADKIKIKMTAGPKQMQDLFIAPKAEVKKERASSLDRLAKDKKGKKEKKKK